MRIVLDTCVLVAAARSLEGASNRILRSFAAGARYIVTHNTRDFAGSDQLGIQAMTPGNFYRLVFNKT